MLWCRRATIRRDLKADLRSPAASHASGSTHRPSHELTGKQQQILSKCDTCQRAMQPPSYQDCDLFSDGTMITVEHQPPPASISSASSCLKQSLCQVHTLLQPEEGGGYSSPFSEPANVQLMQRHRRRHASCMHAGSVKP